MAFHCAGEADVDVLYWVLNIIVLALGSGSKIARRGRENRTHVANKARRNPKSGQREAIADLGHDTASRPESRRADERPAADVDSRADDGVGGEHGSEAGEHGAVVMLGLLHLEEDGEVGRDARVGEDDGRHGGHIIHKICVAKELVVGGPWSCLRRVGRTSLHQDGDGEGHHCCISVSQGHFRNRDEVCNIRETRIDAAPKIDNPPMSPIFLIELNNQAPTTAISMRKFVQILTPARIALKQMLMLKMAEAPTKIQSEDESQLC